MCWKPWGWVNRKRSFERLERRRDVPRDPRAGFGLEHCSAMAVGFLHPMVKSWRVRHLWIFIPLSLPTVEGASPPEEISFCRKRGDTGS